LVGLSDGRAADLIRQDRIDILVDLALHTANSRLLVFARKPAPVQVTFAGYPGSTGLTTIDYRLSDPYLDPPGMEESVYSEETIRLPDSFWCYDPLDGREVPVSALPAVSNGFVTFGCLNNFCKINDGVLRLWGKVLQAVPSSRLLLLAPEGSHQQHALEVLGQQGIAPQRIEFVRPQPRRQYLELYQHIDVGLDSFPYNGHTTSLDSFWMGVPVVTLVGRTVVGRAGLCQLMNLKLPELIGHTPEQYVGIASDLANDLPRLGQLRATLRGRMEESALMDAPRFARNVEAAYRAMWRRWCEKAGSAT
jgi:predicted O-linked N-acetylglucosamine transferase (SPINDLY family)